MKEEVEFTSSIVLSPSFFYLMYVKNKCGFYERVGCFCLVSQEKAYLCNMFFMVLDLRLTKVGLGGARFFALN